MNLKQGSLPDFIIIGAQRAGTTSLYEYLIQHPQVLPAKNKEVHFFDHHYEEGIAWYRDRFPTEFDKIIKSISLFGRVVSGEASPYYLFHDKAAERIKAAIPNVKLIVLLRDPIERAYSQYSLSRHYKYETLTFEEAIEKEEDRLKNTEDFNDLDYVNFSYLARGRYAEQLEKWFEFFPRKQFLILQSEKLYKETEATLQSVYDYLGIRSYSGINTKEVHKVAKYSEPMKESTRKKLREYFAPYNKQLFNLIGQTFDWD